MDGPGARDTGQLPINAHRGGHSEEDGGGNDDSKEERFVLAGEVARGPEVRGPPARSHRGVGRMLELVLHLSSRCGRRDWAGCGPWPSRACAMYATISSNPSSAHTRWKTSSAERICSRSHAPKPSPCRCCWRAWSCACCCCCWRCCCCCAPAMPPASYARRRAGSRRTSNASAAARKRAAAPGDLSMSGCVFLATRK